MKFIIFYLASEIFELEMILQKKNDLFIDFEVLIQSKD